MAMYARTEPLQLRRSGFSYFVRRELSHFLHRLGFTSTMSCALVDPLGVRDFSALPRALDLPVWVSVA